MRNFYAHWLLGRYQMGRQHPVISAMIRADMFWFFYLGPLFIVPIATLGIVLPRGFSFSDITLRTRFLLLIMCATLFGELLPVFFSPHYAAPLVCVIYALVIAAMQCTRNWRWRDRPTGLATVRAVPTVAIVLLLVCTAAPALHIRNAPAPETWCSPWGQLSNRAQIQAQMERLPGRHLMLVRYSPQHDPKASWVYNRADIDNSKVVWANDMGPQNRELIEYFKDRRVWLVETDTSPARISAYTGAPQESNADDSN